MALSDDIDSATTTIFNATWNTRDGRSVPTTEDVILSNGAVKLDAVVLYADLFHSTELARTFSRSMAAKIVRAYLSSMTRLVRHLDGHVRSFDGDRVMGIFIGDSKNSNAAECALKMNYVVTKILRPRAEEKFPSLVEKGFTIAHCVGIANSHVFVVRGGVRDANDLVFVGSAPNIAAKLSEIRNSPWHSYMTWSVYKKLNDKAKLGDSGKDMWTAVRCTLGKDEWDCYKSNWTWTP